MYDLIGDIHGHATELEQLLKKLGYEKEEKGYYSHSKEKRQVIFLGDFIDRGPEIRQVLEIVRPMVDSGEAEAVMGNHEFNALAYHTPLRDKPGEYLRPHVFFNEKTGKVVPKNLEQHLKTLQQFPDDELSAYLDWFRKRPLWLELEDENGNHLRVAHACWDDEQIRII
ncbi:MAG: metallophosphoesterase, partial [Planctomycetota bacterium]